MTFGPRSPRPAQLKKEIFLDRSQNCAMANSTDADREEGKLKTPASLGLRKSYPAKSGLDSGYSWIACVVGFLIMFIIGGQNNSTGIIFAALLDEYNSNRGQTGKVFLVLI